MAIKGATESVPFMHHNIVAFKVMDKMFAMASLEPKDGVFWADMKCDPQRSVDLRERYEGIMPGHVKTTLLWNRIILESDVPDELICELIRHSVSLVIEALSKQARLRYLQL